MDCCDCLTHPGTSRVLCAWQRSLAYRDLKPENLLVAANGYLKLCDFGFIKSIPYTDKKGEQFAQSFTMLGSPDYLPPEVRDQRVVHGVVDRRQRRCGCVQVILTKGHERSVDLWSLGAVIYELLLGVTPYKEDNQNKVRSVCHSWCRRLPSLTALPLQTFERACRRDLRWPDGFREEHPDAADLVERLMTVEPSQRLGAGHRGLKDVMDHSWFHGFDWDALHSQYDVVVQALAVSCGVSP